MIAPMPTTAASTASTTLATSDNEDGPGTPAVSDDDYQPQPLATATTTSALSKDTTAVGSRQRR